MPLLTKLDRKARCSLCHGLTQDHLQTLIEYFFMYKSPNLNIKSCRSSLWSDVYMYLSRYIKNFDGTKSKKQLPIRTRIRYLPNWIRTSYSLSVLESNNLYRTKNLPKIDHRYINLPPQIFIFYHCSPLLPLIGGLQGRKGGNQSLICFTKCLCLKGTMVEYVDRPKNLLGGIQ